MSAHRFREVHWAAMLMGFVLQGCGEEQRPFPPTGRVEQVPESVVLEVLEPKGEVEVGPRAKLTCEVRVQLPRGGLPPTVVEAIFRDGGRDISSISLEPREKTAGSYYYESTCRAPSRPGTYRLVALCYYYVEIPEGEDDAAGESGAAPGPRVRRKNITEAGPVVRVHQ